MRKLRWPMVALAVFSAPIFAQTDDAAEPPVQNVTNPQIGTTYTIQRQGTLAEGYDARLVTLEDVAIVNSTLRSRTNGRERTIVRAGTVLIREDENWFLHTSPRWRGE